MMILKTFKRHIRDKLLLKKLSKFNLQDALINEDGTITFIGNVNLSGLGLKKIPFKFKNVHGDFDCSNNNLVSLKNSPENVGGKFNCSVNKLASLKYGPRIVSEHFICSQNNLENLNFGPDTIKDLNAQHNLINTLEYFPKVVRGDCLLGGNKIHNIDTLKRTEIRGDIFFSDLLICGSKPRTNKNVCIKNAEIKHKFDLDDIREQMNTLDLSLSKKEVSASRKVKI